MTKPNMNEESPELFLIEAMLADNPSDAILAQESRGQRDLCSKDVLPKEINGSDTRSDLENMGIQFHDDVDDLFIHVTLPQGWKKCPTGHSMWSELLDTQGKIRAMIFYKAAFYDRHAFIRLETVFTYQAIPVHGWDNLDYENDSNEVVCIVKRFGLEVWRSEILLGRYVDIVQPLGKAWLEENYPDWENPLAYWELS